MKTDASFLTDVPETLFIPLAARAYAPRLFPEIGFRDPSAEAVVANLNADVARFGVDRSSLYGVVRRTQTFTGIIRSFLERNPDALVVNLGAGLSDYFPTVDNGRCRWVNLDLPVVTGVRDRILPPRNERERTLTGSIFDFSWVKDVERKPGQPVFVLCEGISMYFPHDELKTLFSTVAENFAGAEMAFDHFFWLIIGREKWHPSVRKTKAHFRWGMRSLDEVRAFHPRTRIFSQKDIFADYPFPYSVLCPIVRAATGTPFYGVTHLGFAQG